ncbi:hypothetical protein E2C01_054226 [Portunus trituberculatus]|uniref:Uncharacterized protein n=1 Tax=Portunus trituberculatus TaxID=210409 RepID=A0A5B7GT62_PORTR|nr:hypothetical protein [Portunus trituberculatus]
MTSVQFIRATRDRSGWKSMAAHVLEDMAQRSDKVQNKQLLQLHINSEEDTHQRKPTQEKNNTQHPPNITQ